MRAHPDEMDLDDYDRKLVHVMDDEGPGPPEPEETDDQPPTGGPNGHRQ